MLSVQIRTRSPIQGQEPKQSKQTLASAHARARMYARTHTRTYARTHARTESGDRSLICKVPGSKYARTWHMCMHGLTLCVVVRCTQNAPRRQQFHVAPIMSAPLSTQVRCIFRNALWKASYSCRITRKCCESAREWRIALYKTDQQQHMRARTHYWARSLDKDNQGQGCLL